MLRGPCLCFPNSKDYARFVAFSFWCSEACWEVASVIACFGCCDLAVTGQNDKTSVFAEQRGVL